MAVNLNDSLYGAQFRAFQALADDTKLDQDALVNVDESGRGKGLLNEAGVCLSWAPPGSPRTSSPFWI